MSEMLQNERKVNSKVLILIFSILALIGLIFTEIIFTLENIFYLVEYFDVRYAIYAITSPLASASFAIPCVLLIIYACFLYKKINSRAVLALSFVSFCYYILDFFIDEVADLIFYENISEYLLNDFVFEVLPFALLLLAAILVLFGIKYRVFYIVPLVFAAFPSIYYFMGCVDSSVDLLTNAFNDFHGAIDSLSESWSYYLVAPVWNICNVLAIVAIIIFVAENSSLLSKKKESKTPNETIENA